MSDIWGGPGRAGTVQSGTWEALGILSVYLMKGTKEGRSGLFSVVPSDWARGNGYQWKHKEILLNMEDLFTYKGCRTLAQAAQRGDGDHLG